MFDLIDYNITDAVVTFEEGVYAENVMTKIRMDAAKYGKPVISVGVEHDDCISIKFGYAKGFEQVVRHVIEQHGVRDIGFIAGRKDEENSEERIAVSESYSRSMISHSEMMSFITVTIGLFLL